MNCNQISVLVSASLARVAVAGCPTVLGHMAAELVCTDVCQVHEFVIALPMLNQTMVADLPDGCVAVGGLQGADGPLSGLIAMLAALHALHASATSNSSSDGSAGFSSYSKRIVFMALAGEPWGYMGSRRLLYEASSGSNNTAGLNMSLVEQVGP
jgi:hypothetical protein